MEALTKSELLKDLADAINARAEAVGEAAKLRARHPAFAAQRLHKNKFLYFILCGDAVKIGVSSNPECRMDEIKVGSPGQLSLLAKIPNAGNREREIHKRLSHLRLHGEWFRYTAEVQSLIEELR